MDETCSSPTPSLPTPPLTHSKKRFFLCVFWWWCLFFLQLECALVPFCWGWRGALRWCGYAAFAVLCVALALTYSRTGVAVLAAEMASWGVMNWRGGIFGRANSRPSRNGRAGARPSRCCRYSDFGGKVATPPPPHSKNRYK